MLHSLFLTAALAAAGEWTQLSNGPYSAREGLMAIANLTDGSIMLSGGRDRDGSHASDEVWKSTDGTDWTKLPSPGWKARSYHAMMELNGCVYVIAGQGFSVLGSPYYNDVWRSCDGGMTWKELPNAPFTARSGIACTVFNGKMYIAGGCYSGAGGKRSFLNDVWATSDGENWECLTSGAEWSARSGPRLVVHKDKLLILGGEIGFKPDTQLGDIWASSNGGANWTLIAKTPGFEPRSGHGVVVSNEKVYVIAGWVDNKAVHDLWVSTDGATYTFVSNSSWNCADDSCGKFDFWPVVTSKGVMTVGGAHGYSTFGKMWKDTWLLEL